MSDSIGANVTDKRQKFLGLLEEGIATLHLDARQLAVRVPRHLKSRSWLVLNYSYRYRLPDLNVDERGVSASLSFGGVPFACFVPWSAVFAISDERQIKQHWWPEHAPGDVLDALLQHATTEAREEERGERSFDDDCAAESAPTGSPSPTEPAKKRGHLKIVK